MKRVWGIPGILLAILLVVGCEGRFEYVRPLGLDARDYSRTVEKSKDEVWREFIQTLDTRFFVIDCLDKDFGIILLSYVGNPERYVDCGYITSYVKNVGGERTYRFPAAAGSMEYELMQGDGLLFITRRMNLEGRINVTVVEIGDKQTRISVSVRYTVTRTLSIRDTLGRSQVTSNAILFSSGQEGAFPGTGVCRPTGLLEEDVLLSAPE